MPIDPTRAKSVFLAASDLSDADWKRIVRFPPLGLIRETPKD